MGAMLTPRARCAPSRACGEGWGGGSRGDGTGRAIGSGIRGESPTRLASLGTLPRKREREHHTDAVVTPPSTTMVWPVMKVEASEAR